jgi:hypothetical protein
VIIWIVADAGGYMAFRASLTGRYTWPAELDFFFEKTNGNLRPKNG